MTEYVLDIVAQSANFKLSVSHSKDTGVYATRELVDFLGGRRRKR